jgi:bifunctional non-homologous end joining protein LigD
LELPGAAAAEIPRDIRLQIVSPGAQPPEGEGWLHEINHDGHRLLASARPKTLSFWNC